MTTYFESDFEPAFDGDVPWYSPEERRRHKVEEELIAVIATWARDHGYTSLSSGNLAVIRRQFPKVPMKFCLRALSKLGRESDDAYLDDLANTIEGELIKRAIGGQA